MKYWSFMHPHLDSWRSAGRVYSRIAAERMPRLGRDVAGAGSDGPTWMIAGILKAVGRRRLLPRVHSEPPPKTSAKPKSARLFRACLVPAHTCSNQIGKRLQPSTTCISRTHQTHPFGQRGDQVAWRYWQRHPQTKQSNRSPVPPRISPFDQLIMRLRLW